MSPQGDKSAYTRKQRRQAHHIENSEMRRGKSRRTAERIGWATVNKQDRGGKRKRSSATRRSAGRGRPKRSAGGSRRKTASRSR